MRGASRSVYFATKNKAKYLEAARIAAAYGVHLKYLPFSKREIQAEDLREIASFAAMEAARSRLRAVVAEDAGFFVEALKGFPGPYSSYVFKTLGTSGILKLMGNVKNRKASFLAAVSYCEPNRRPISFTGTVRGFVSMKPKGSRGFGFDPIFIPSNGDGRTFAEMEIDEKNAFSHRAKAFGRFARWFTSNR